MISKAARSGLHICLSLLLLIAAILPTIPSTVLAESPDGIIVEDADWVGIDSLEPSPSMPDALPRVVVEYGSSIRHGALEGTTALPDIPARIIVEYGGSIRKSSLEGTTDLPDIPARIMVEYGGSIAKTSLEGTEDVPNIASRIIVRSASSIIHSFLIPMTEEPSPPPVIPGFLTLPSDDPDIKIQQGWRYTAPIGPNPADPYAHNGIDYVTGALNQPATWQPFDVVAAADGVAMQSSGGGYGDFVLIRHDKTDTGGRNYFTLYAHLGAIEDNTTYREDRFATDYENWTPVTRGQKIGVAGDTGSPGLVHLHFEVQRGSYAQNKVDPYDIYETRDYYPGGPVYAGCGANALWMESVCPPPEQFRFAIGEWVRTTANLNVREGPGLGHSVIRTMSLGATAQVLGGPILADGFFWWDVEYAVGVRGWSAENWLELHDAGAPICIVRLQTDGVPVDEIGVWEFFDIHVGHSISDTGIKQVRFSSDHVRDGYPTGRWTDWFDWSASSEDWDATTKTKRWAFDTPGYKEVWAELRDGNGHTAFGLATILVPAPALPVLTSPMVISPAKDVYNVGDTLEAEFTIKNIGDVPITLDVLAVGGRLNGFIPPGGAPDFTFRSVTLLPNVSYEYQGSLTLEQIGQYGFFVAYHIEGPNPDEKKLLDDNNWNTCVELGEGLGNAGRVKNIAVYEQGVVPKDISKLRTEIDRWKQCHLRYQYPAYLRSADTFTDAVATLWTSFTSWATRTDLTKQYDDLYFTGIEYQGLSFQTLIDADRALETGDVEGARRFLESSHRYWRLSAMSFSSATEVFIGSLEAGMILAKGIKDGCQAAVSVGVKIVYPPAAPKVDAAFTAIDFVVTTMIEGPGEATKDLITRVIVKQLFKHVTFTFLDGSTLEDYVNAVREKATLVELLSDEEFMEEFGQVLQMIIADRVVVETGIEFGEMAAEELTRNIIDYLLSLINSLRSEVKSPVELRVVDSIDQVTGLTDKGVRHEIPMSFYDGGMVEVFFPSDFYRYDVIGMDKGMYGLEITYLRAADTTAFGAKGVVTSPDAIHRYSVDWDALTQGEHGITIEKDHDGDGEIDETIITGIPQTPTDPSPANNARDVSLNTALSWTGDDSGSVTYNVYFGTDMDPPLVSERQPETTYLPVLQPYTRYYWRVAAINEHSISSTGSAWNFITQGAGIVGEVRDVRCDILYGVNITLYHHGEVMPTAFSDVGGSYVVRVLDPGQYELVASKDGFRDVRQWIDVTELGHEYELHFRADHGLIPTAPNMSYVLSCINLWQFGEPQCKLGMSTVLAVINAWQFPVEAQAVTFLDANLEAAIREAIDKPTGDIYPSDLEGLTYLDASRRNISDLTGLEHCTNLIDVNLWDNQIGGISPLANLTRLTDLDLGYNQISDISPVANLTNLTSLRLHNNPIGDISPLATLTELTTFSLSGHEISGVSLVVDLTRLTSLGLKGVTDISDLANLTNLISLFLYSDEISDISPMASLTNLTSLAFASHQVSDILPLEGLTNLDRLYLWGNQISDVSPLEGLTNLDYLLLSSNQISDISALANLTSLQELTLVRSQISDISALANLTNLTMVQLTNNQIASISPLANLTELTVAYLSGNQITDISALASLVNLTWLTLQNNQISDISPLVQNEGLGSGDTVWLGGNPLSSDSINVYIPHLQARGVTVYY